MAEVEIVIKGTDRGAAGAIRSVRGALSELASVNTAPFERVNSLIGTGLKAAAGVGLGALAGIGAGLGAAAVSGFGFNNTMEQTVARLNAFTKDGEESARILEMIRDRAARTPFAFEEMAQAAAGLMPAARGANESLESMVETAEILAASNPAQGLEGAAFALREAVGGDFVSLIERFDLPRGMINDLKEQGLPNIEIVRQAMLAMGYDADLVANLAETASGRWGSFKDTLQGLAATAMAPIFDRVSAGLGQITEYLSREDVAARISLIAAAIGEDLGRAADWLASTVIPALLSGWSSVSALFAANGPALAALASNMAAFAQSVGAFVSEHGERLLSILLGVGAALATFSILGTVVTWVSGVVAAFGAFSTAAAGLGGGLAALVALLGGPVVIAVGLVAAAVGVLVVAWTQNWGGIQEKTAAAWAFIQPILQALWDWLVVRLGDAILRLSVFWTGTLQPALQLVWGFIQTSLIPLLQALANVALAGLEVATIALQAVWTGLLYPALQAVAEIAGPVLTPIINALRGALDNMGPAVSTGAGLVATLRGALDGLASIIERIIGALNRMADAIRSLPSIDLPDLPGFATGTLYAPGGWSVVGERGPEMVYLPRGSRVEPSGQTRARGATEERPLVININGGNLAEVRRVIADELHAAGYRADNRLLLGM